MALYKRGGVYWYNFKFNGESIQASAKTGNKEAARQIEAAHRVRLARGEAGIYERVPAPTFRDFAPRFESAIVTEHADKPATIGFYQEKLRRLLEDSQLAGTRLDLIDEAIIDGYKQRRSRQASRYGRPLSPASVNRELATLRRLLGLAQTWKVIDRIPRIRKLSGEEGRTYIVSHGLESRYLEAATQPLKDVAILMLETGVRPSEALHLKWEDVHLQPAIHAALGYISVAKTAEPRSIKKAGKSKYSKRNLSLTVRAAAMLKARKIAATSSLVFPSDSQDGSFLGTSLDHQHHDVRTALNLDTAFVVYSLRHTMLTRLGEAGADAFTIMKIAGHSSVTVSQRYVHPTPEGMERAFQRLESLNAAKFQAAEMEAKEAVNAYRVPTVFTTPKKQSFRKISASR